MIDTGLIFTRFLHYAATLVLFGVALSPLYTYRRHKIDGVGGRRCLLAASWALLLAILVSGALWFVCVAMSITDAGISWQTSRFVLTETTYGAICLMRLGTIAAICCVLVLLTLRPVYRLDVPLAALSAFLAASLAGTGHTQVEEGLARLGHMFADALHLVGAGAWLGGLVVLFCFTATSLHPSSTDSRQIEACNAAHRFSRMGYAAVATIIGSGLINSWFLVGSFANLISTPYGQLLLIKLALFFAMLGFAGFNRFFIVPVLLNPTALAYRKRRGLNRLRLHILAEQGLGFAIILLVSLLGMMEPAINSPQ